MPRNLRDLIPAMTAIDLDPAQNIPRAADEVGLNYQIQSLERLLSPVRHPQVAHLGFIFQNPFLSTVLRLTAGPKGARIKFAQNATIPAFPNVSGVNIAIAPAGQIHGTYGLPITFVSASWGAPFQSILQSGTDAGTLSTIFNLLVLGDSLSESDVAIELYPGDQIHWFSFATDTLAVRVVWDEPA